MKTTVCVVCWAPIQVADDYDELKHVGVCTPACASHEHLFNKSFSNEVIGEQNFKDFGVDTWKLEQRKRYGKKTKGT